MIDFKSLQFVANMKYSYVGIEKRKGSLYFFLPKGFDTNSNRLNGFNNNQNLFFLFYKIIKTFKKICIDKGYLDKDNELTKKDRDGVINANEGSKIQDDGDDLENVFYAKLDIIGNLLDAYDEPKILSLAYRLGKVDRFDLSQIHKYLHQAIYLSNNAAYVDQMLLPRKVVQFESTDIVAMYCYLFCEVKQQLKENVSTEITSLSERFREKYLRSGDSLFDEQSYEQVLDILKDALEIIDHNTPIKDADYWQYYEAIELFLYGDLNKEEDGEIWGVSNFHSVWESMCLTYICKSMYQFWTLKLDTRYIEKQHLSRFKSISKVIDLKDTFNLNKSELLPDVVLLLSKLTKSSHQKYIFYKDNWNDYFYHTTFSDRNLADKNKSKEIKIAYINQKAFDHTNETINKLYFGIPNETSITINTRLPKNFYSWWDLDEKLNLEEIQKMYYLNHFFYLALDENLVTWESFLKNIFEPLKISYISNLTKTPKNTDNAFTHSLFRDGSSSRMIDFKELKEKFNNFINQAFFLFKDLFEIEIIDVKYEVDSNFRDPNQINHFKSKDIRKQFVYEYLLQKHLEKREDQFSDLPIRSSFWLPSYRPDDSNLIEDGETFMDGYIQLKNINFAVLAENYIA